MRKRFGLTGRRVFPWSLFAPPFHQLLGARAAAVHYLFSNLDHFAANRQQFDSGGVQTSLTGDEQRRAHASKGIERSYPRYLQERLRMLFS